MKQKHNRRKALWITLFVILIGVSGLALAASGNLENPLGMLGDAGSDRGQRGAPPSGTTNQTSSTQAPQNAGLRGEGGDQSSFNWSQIGSVLYNVWFLFAITGIIVVIQTVGGGVVQRVKTRLPKAASP